MAKVKVVDILECPITLKQAIARETAYIIESGIYFSVSYAFLAFGYGIGSETFISVADYYSFVPLAWLVINSIVCIKSKKHRALHDFIAGTVVVRLDMVTEEPSDKKLYPPGPEEYADLTA